MVTNTIGFVFICALLSGIIAMLAVVAFRLKGIKPTQTVYFCKDTNERTPAPAKTDDAPPEASNNEKAWADININGFEPAYEISQQGKVRDKKTKQEVPQRYTNSGNAVVRLTHGKHSADYSVALLVARAFLKGCGEKVVHLNGVLADNNVANLKWENESFSTSRSKEMWRHVYLNGVDTMYLVSNKARFVSPNGTPVDRGKHVEALTGEERVTLFYYVNGERVRRQIYVSKIVAGAFVENPNNYHFVMHIDGDNKNNNADNLAWVYGRKLENRRK